MYRWEDWDQLKAKINGNILEKFYNDDLIKNITINIKKEQIIPKGTKFYRARIFDASKISFNSAFEGFNEEYSLAPKPDQVKEPGRVNKTGESVLYVAEDTYTAMAETRTGKKQTVSIAEIEFLKDLRVFEFKYVDCGGCENDIEQIYHHIAFEFYLTVNNDKEKRYLVTQYIAKKIKELGFDGIKYSSSLSEKGMNLAIFEPKIAKANNSKCYLIQSILYFAEKHDNGSNNENLLPKSITDKFTPEEIDYFFNRMKQGSMNVWH